MTRLRWIGPLVCTWLGTALLAQQPAPPASTDDDKKDEGIPVTSALVRQKCAGCHRADDKGHLTRISYRRTTPEGWEETIKRMVTLNDVKIEPSEAREILRYLADHHGLAPEEARPAA
jgi:quinohemoprotein amine dehydrogenase